MYDVIREIVDDGDWFDLKPKFAKTLITCFARFGGQPAGIVANQPKHLAGILDNDSADKAARFINLCDAFNIPLVFLQDVPGFMVGSKVEHAGIIRHGAKMLYAVSRATVPKVTVVVRKAYGAGYYVMCGKAYEPDLIVAWPGAEISVMGAEGAVEIIGRSMIEASDDPEATREAMLNAVRQQIDPYIAAGNAVIDDIIDPRETRQTIAKALRMARNKHVEKPKKRHGVMPVDEFSFDDPVIISCSISGVIANRDQCPAIPYTPEEYAAEARRAVDEGASQIHIHARKPDGTPSYEVEDFQAITEAILAEVGDVIVNYSTGAIGIPIEKRIEYLRACRPDVAALNMSSMNYAKYSQRRKDFVFKAVFENSFDTIIEFLTAMKELGIKPEHECFDSGHVANLDPLVDMGLLEPPLQISLVMGVTGGIRPTPRNVTLMSDQIPGGPEGPNQWQVIGISRDQWKLLASSLVLGGNVRAGVEDNLYLPNGEMCKSNGELIAKARQMAEDIGRRPASVAEARELLGVPKRERVFRLATSRSSTSPACCRAASARCCSPTSAPRC